MFGAGQIFMLNPKFQAYANVVQIFGGYDIENNLNQFYGQRILQEIWCVQCTSINSYTHSNYHLNAHNTPH